jgi:two-component system, cell cycle sensor histidine kinase and response regulator CckA
LDVSAPESQEPVPDKIEEKFMRKDGSTFVAEPAAYNGRPITVETNTHGIKINSGGEGLMRGVNGHHSLEGEMSGRALFFEAIPDALILMELDGRIVDWNRAAERIFEYRKEEVIGRESTFLRQVALDSDFERNIRRALKYQNQWSGELPFKRKGGTQGIADVLVVKQTDGDGNPHSIIGICRDVTEKKQLDEELRQSEKMEALGQLAGIAAHDFNNLLALITGYSDLVLKRLPSGPDPIRKKIEDIRKTADRGVALTRRLLSFSRPQDLEIKMVDVNALIDGLAERLRHLLGEDISLRTSLDAVRGQVKADPGQIELVIMNLAENALDAMPRGGTLTIETRDVEPGEPFSRRCESLQPGPHIMIAVSDTGGGLTPATLAHIFEPFFTTKEKGKGAGLGLSIVYGIVKRSGGSIRVYSEVGVGTTFKIYLPRTREAVEPNISGVVQSEKS